MSDTAESNKSQKVTVTFEVLGKRYSLPVAPESESAFRRAAKRLSDRIGQLAQRYNGSKFSLEDFCVYAAVEIITTCFEEKDNNQEASTISSLVSLEQKLDDILLSRE